MKMVSRAICIALVAGAFAGVAVVSGCTSRQAYMVGQGWQRNECTKILNQQDQQRCMAGANTSYDQYKRQRKSAQEVR